MTDVDGIMPESQTCAFNKMCYSIRSYTEIRKKKKHASHIIYKNSLLPQCRHADSADSIPRILYILRFYNISEAHDFKTAR